ncbi:MAG: ribosome recycling factor [Patescibacteria group bacterium]|nr:ribosome recycling factor [Patescibacteria group bacterium]
MNEFKQKLNLAIERLTEDLKKVRTGRAHPDMLDGVRVEAYGVMTPLNQVANVTVPEPQLIQITPFDPSNIDAVTEAIKKDEALGLNPSDDGRVVRVNIPPLTEERRAQIAKQLGTNAEDARIVSRNLRQDLLSGLKKQKSAGEITEDDLRSLEKQVQDELDKFNKQVDELIGAKEAEVMKV